MDNKFKFIPQLLKFADKVQDIVKIVNAGIKGYRAFMDELKNLNDERKE